MVYRNNKLFCFLIFLPCSLQAYHAVVTVPVADCFEEPLPATFDIHEYDGPGVSEDTKKEKNPRTYQLLFNEIVDVIDSHDGYLLVAIPHIVYCGNGREALKNTYWIQKEVVISLDKLSEETISKMPPAIYSSYKTLAECNKNIITLTIPFYDFVTKKVYSAGTRFLLAKKNGDDYFTVWILDVKEKCCHTTQIPKGISIAYKSKTKRERIADFVHLVKWWANQPNGFIPYVWGGASFCYVAHKKSPPPRYIYCGIDCSCLVSRAAQICGIPYFLKNSTTIEATLQPLDPDKKLHDGDLVWFPGHIIVITSVKNNLLVHARGYGSGYGSLHEVSLNTLFKDITTYNDLMQAYKQQRPLYLFDKKGKICRIMPYCKIFSFSRTFA